MLPVSRDGHHHFTSANGRNGLNRLLHRSSVYRTDPLRKGAERRKGAAEFAIFTRVFRMIAVPAPVRPQWLQVEPEYG
jgi:hypothetical protein